MAKPKKGFKNPDKSVSQKEFAEYFISQEPKRVARKTVSGKFSKSGKRKSKLVRSKSRPKQRRDSTKFILDKKDVNIGNSTIPMQKAILRITLRKRKIKIDQSLQSRVNLKQVIQEFIRKPSVKKKFKIKKDSRGLIRVVFKEIHKEPKKLRKKEDKEFNSKKHHIAVSTVVIKINSIEDFIGSVDFLMEFLQQDIERYIKYTEIVNKTSLLLDYIELVKYEKLAKKNKNRPKTKKGSKKVRSIRR